MNQDKTIPFFAYPEKIISEHRFQKVDHEYSIHAWVYKKNKKNCI